MICSLHYHQLGVRVADFPMKKWKIFTNELHGYSPNFAKQITRNHTFIKNAVTLQQYLAEKNAVREECGTRTVKEKNRTKSGISISSGWGMGKQSLTCKSYPAWGHHEAQNGNSLSSRSSFKRFTSRLVMLLLVRVNVPDVEVVTTGMVIATMV